MASMWPITAVRGLAAMGRLARCDARGWLVPLVVGPAAGLSIVLALAALLMLAVPLAARRLRLDCESWRLAPFVLIADRPG